MNIRAEMRVTEPGAVEFEVTIRAPLEWWQKLAQQFSGGQYPGWHIRSLVARLTDQAAEKISETQEWEP